ncbi:hypothetical protein GCM10023149_30980 [Mucilaginibacter gynuensis]|uniref:Uncharacterized protein n=1 Tax=Mucilaginibacter gynuensis TaxID=1302236 RepID=A0ABP8GP87_9SPHI
MSNIQNATISYKLRLTHGEQKGKVIDLDIDLDNLQEDDISDRLIADGYYQSICHPHDYYEVVDRYIKVENEQINSLLFNDDTIKAIALRHVVESFDNDLDELATAAMMDIFLSGYNTLKNAIDVFIIDYAWLKQAYTNEQRLFHDTVNKHGELNKQFNVRQSELVNMLKNIRQGYSNLIEYEILNDRYKDDAQRVIDKIDELL